MKTKFVIAASVLSAVLASPVFATTLTVQDTLGTFNMVTQTYSGTQEVEGRAYVGSTLSGVTGQFGFVDAGDGQSFAALTVNGDLENSTINLTPSTSADISGSSINSNVNNGTLNEGVTDIPMFDFAAFQAESDYIASLTGVSADLSDMNNKVFGGASIIDVDLADLSSGGYSFDLSGLDSVIINVSGTTGTFNMNPLGGTKGEAPSILWNFFEATDITVNSVISGHVLAAGAVMRGFSGSTEGTVIAREIQLTNGELHQQSWNGTVPTATVEPSPVPLPAGLPLLVGGIAVLAGLRRLKGA